MNEIFLSYSRRNIPFAKQLFTALQNSNRSVWADWDDIPAASDWDAEIKEGIRQAESVIFVLTPDWLKSAECKKELDYAVQMGKRLFPILHINIDARDVPPELGKINWVYMRESENFDKELQTLCAAMDANLDWLKTHTRLQVRAVEWDKKNRDNSFALRGNDLIAAEKFLADASHNNPEPTQLQKEYILASRKDASQRQRLTLIGVTMALVVSVILGVLALFQWQAAVVARAEAITERDRADQNAQEAIVERDRADLNAKMSFARELAFAANYNLVTDPERSLLLALQAVQVAEQANQPIPFEVENAVRLASQESRVRHVLLDNNLETDTQSVSFSPDGRLLATASWSGNTILWDVTSTPKKILSLENPGSVRRVAFSPTGELIATTNLDQFSAILWNPETGKPVRSLIGHTAPLWSVAFSRDGRYLATASEDTTVRIWEVSTGQELLVLQGHTMDVRSAVFSPDGRYVASGGSDAQLIVWDAATGAVISTYKNNSQIWDVKYNPNGSQLAFTDGGVNGVTVLNAETFELLYQKLYHTEIVRALDYSPDGSLLVTTSWDTTSVVLNAGDGSIAYVLKGHFGRTIMDVAFSPSGDSIATAGDLGIYKLWDTSRIKGGEAGRIEASLGPINSLVYSPDGSLLAAAGEFSSAAIHDLVNNKTLRLEGHTAGVNAIAFSPDGKTVVTGSWDGKAILWDVNTGRQVREVTGGSAGVLGAAFNRDGSLLALTTTENVLVFNTQTFDTVYTFPANTEGYWYTSASFSVDGKYVAAISTDWTTSIWNLETGERGLLLEGHTEWGTDVSFSPSRPQLITASGDRKAIIWDAETGNQLFTLEHSATISSVDYNPDGSLVATASYDGTARVWNSATGAPLFTLFPYAGPLRAVAFSPNGKYIATAGQDGIIRIDYVDFENVLALALSRITRSLTEEECRAYLHEAACPETIIKP